MTVGTAGAQLPTTPKPRSGFCAHIAHIRHLFFFLDLGCGTYLRVPTLQVQRKPSGEVAGGGRLK